MRKLISLLLILILLLSSMTFLASCNEDTPPEESSSESDSVAESNPPAQSDAKIDFSEIDFPDWISDDDVEMLKQLILEGPWNMYTFSASLHPYHMTKYHSPLEAEALVNKSGAYYSEILKKENAVDLLLWLFDYISDKSDPSRPTLPNEKLSFSFHPDSFFVLSYQLYHTDAISSRITEAQKNTAKELWEKVNTKFPGFEEKHKELLYAPEA